MLLLLPGLLALPAAGRSAMSDPAAAAADAFVEIPKIAGDFDFVFLDAWKPDYVRFFNLLKDRIAPGGAFTAHNVVSQEEEMRDFVQAVRNDPAFETTFHKVTGQDISVSIRRKQTP